MKIRKVYHLYCGESMLPRVHSTIRRQLSQLSQLIDEPVTAACIQYLSLIEWPTMTAGTLKVHVLLFRLCTDLIYHSRQEEAQGKEEECRSKDARWH